MKKAITKSFFSAVNLTDFLVSFLLKRFLMQLSINLIGNAVFLSRFTGNTRVIVDASS